MSFYTVLHLVPGVSMSVTGLEAAAKRYAENVPSGDAHLADTLVMGTDDLNYIVGKIDPGDFNLVLLPELKDTWLMVGSEGMVVSQI